MEKVAIDEVDSWLSPASAKRPLSRALGAENVAINYYELAPGESFAFGYHSHEGQEEVFYVTSGEATFETEEGPVTVGAGELVRFAPGEWQQGRNDGDERVRALALGAPAESGDADIERECENCGERTLQDVVPPDEGDELLTKCVDCGEVTGRFD
jgi:mannose-6-phosphate isomerase-like protein (cupin superfamily)